MKFRFCRLLLFAFLGLSSAFAQDLVINEIMYQASPPVPEDVTQEWVELYNRGTNAVNLKGWSFSRGVSFVFSNDTVIPARGYLVVAANVASFAARYPTVTNVVGGWTGSLANNGEEIEIEDANGENIDSVAYATQGDWAIRQPGPLLFGHYGWEWFSETEGLGKSFELRNPNFSNNNGQNWGASTVNFGTPGRTNSLLVNNIAPVISDLAHFPAVPKSTDPIRISARLSDEGGPLTVSLFYRNASVTNPAPFSSLSMFDDGAHGDGAAGDFIFAATLGAQTNNTVIEFYVEARDSLNARRTWPAPARQLDETFAQTVNALFQVDDSVYTGPNQPFYRVIMTRREFLELEAIGGQDGADREIDSQMNGTFISTDGTGTEIVYNAGFRNRGNGSRTIRPNNIRINFPNDRRWKGVRALNINVDRSYLQVFGPVLFQKSGLNIANSRAVQVRVNNTPGVRGSSPPFNSYAANEELSSEFVDNHFPTDNDGNLYRGVRISGTERANLDFRGEDPAAYQNAYRKQNNSSAFDFSDVIELTRVLSNAPANNYVGTISNVLDIDAALKYFAVNTMVDNNETALSNGDGDDYAMYRGAIDTRFKLMGYDTDSIIGGSGSSSSASLFRMTNGAGNSIDRFITHPDITPRYYAELKRLIDTTFQPDAFNTLLVRTIGDWVTPVTLTNMVNWVIARNAYVSARIPLKLTVQHTLSVVGGYPRTTLSSITLSGQANIIDTRSVRVNGVLGTWNHLNGVWTAGVTGLRPGINRVVVQAFDSDGVEIDQAFLDIHFDTGGTIAVPASIAADTTWTAAGGPYLASSTVTVQPGATLTIQAGATVYFSASAGLNINGRLVVAGTEYQRVRFTRVPGSGVSNSWAGLHFINTAQSNVLSYLDIEYAGSSSHSIELDGSTLYADHLSFSGTTRNLIDTEDSSLLIRQSVFPSIANAEHIHGSRIPPTGFVIIDGNTFGTTTGLNDIIDFTGGQRPGPILQILNNLFTGASDDMLDLDGTDALIEGNIFVGAHQQTPGGDTSSAISGGADNGTSSELTIVRNIIYDCDYAVLCKEGNFYTIVNNTIVGMTRAAINFSEPARNTLPGAGAYLDGNIIWNTATNFANRFPTNGTVALTVNRSILSGADFPVGGTGNLQADPHFVNPNPVTISDLTNDFQLLAGSPAAGTGPNGLDMGALVPAGASISGEPNSPTTQTSATLTVGGPGITHYRYRLNNDALSAEFPIGTPISLSALANGSYTVFVIGRNDAGVWQPLSNRTASRSWTVNSAFSRLVINEILADNVAALQQGGGYPDLVELLNSGGGAINLSGFGLTDDPEDKFKFRFPPGIQIQPNQHLVLYGNDPDGSPGIHFGFGLGANGDALYLYDDSGALLDSVSFGLQLPDLSIGRIGNSWRLTRPTFGAANRVQPTGDLRAIKINEWLAAGAGLFVDDYIELYNPDSLPVDLGESYLTDAPQGSPTLSQIPPLSFIAGFGFRVFIADGNPGADHVNFKLSAEQGQIALFSPKPALIDCIVYGPQTAGVAEGRRPNGGTTIVSLGPPTPGAPNPGPPPINCFVADLSLNLLTFSNSWRFTENENLDNMAWFGTNFSDANWVVGPGVFAFPADEAPAQPLIRTVLSDPRTAAPGQAAPRTYYFRTRIPVATNLAGLTITATTLLDDGAIIYLNGQEIRRIRLTTNVVRYSTLANSSVEATFETFTIPGDRFIVGTNLLAVELHQQAANSSDAVFGMSMSVPRFETNCVPLGVIINEVLANNSSITNSDGSVTDWVELFNPSSTNVNLAGMTLSDDLLQPGRWAFPSGVSLAPGGYLVVKFDPASPASTSNSGLLNTGFGLSADSDQVLLFDAPSAGGSQRDAIAFGIQARDYSIGRHPAPIDPWKLTLPSPGAANIGAVLAPASSLKVNEWMADPDGGDDWFEIYNPSAQPVALGGLFLTDNVGDPNQFEIPALSFIGTGEEGFVRFEADNAPARGANHTNFRLSASGESLAIFFADGLLIDSVDFFEQENGVSEGRFPDGSSNIERFPGTPTPSAPNVRRLLNVVISEVLSHSDLPYEDAIELHNPTATAVDISGWFLSDSRREPRLFRIPDGTILEPGGFAVFYEADFNLLPGFFPSFALSSAEGEDLFLFTADAAGNLTGFRADAEFGPAENAVSMGLFKTSQGFDFTALAQRTFGADSPTNIAQFRTGQGRSNAVAKVGPVVINEIMYHPPDIGTNDNSTDEFIELRNVSGAPVSLFHSLFPTNTWRLRDSVDFNFPTNITLAANAHLLVVSFNPTSDPAALAAFRARYSLDSSVPVLGPYAGKLANDNDNLELYKPDAPQDAASGNEGFVPYILVDKVRYTDTAPWPTLADGSTNGVGYSLQRRIPTNYGNDPVNWIAGVPTPGAGTGSAVVAAPVITGISPSQSQPRGASPTFTVSATGADFLEYQWRFNGVAIAGATEASLALSDVQLGDAGTYSVVVFNGAGAANASLDLVVQDRPEIVRDPQSVVAVQGGTALLSVVARGTPPLTYQWRKNGTAIPGETKSTLRLQNIQSSDEASYVAVVSNGFGSVTSAPASIFLVSPPVIASQPLSTNVFVGGSVSFVVGAQGTPPLGYQWRFEGQALLGQTNPVLTLQNVQLGQAGNYSVRVTNAYGVAVSAPANLTVNVPPSVTVVATDPSAREPGQDTGRFTVTRSGSTSQPLSVHFTVSGSAVVGSDYAALSSPVVIPAGQSSALIQVIALDDSELEGNESVTVTLNSGIDYVAGNPNAATVIVFDNDNLAPSVTLTEPAPNSSYSTPVNIPLSALADDGDGAVAKVEFFYNGTNKIGEKIGSPYTLIWSNAVAGSNLLTAVATDNLGATGSSAPVPIFINAAPSVRITSPLSGETVVSPATFTIQVTAADIDGQVTLVEFFSGSTLIGTDNTAPYSLVYSNVPVGSYTFTARATDDRNATTTSTLVNVTVTPPVPEFNDNFNQRGLVTGFTNNVNGNSAAYTRETGEPMHDSKFGNRSAWISWTAPASGICRMDTLGSSFDTVMAVYTGNTLSGLVLVISNDDANDLTVQSAVEFQAVSGVTYQVAIDGFGAGQGGAFAFHFTLPNPFPVITSHPQNQTVNQGATVTFSVSATGPAPLAYQWQRNGFDIPGATGSTLTMTNVDGSKAGSYVAVVSNSSGAVSSSAATLTVRTAPIITAHPQSQITLPGGTAVFSVSASSSLAMTYQWRFNGVNIPGATGSTLTVNNSQYTNGGNYSVRIVNSVGNVTSQDAELIVRPRLIGISKTANGGYRLTYQGTPNKSYAVERAATFGAFSNLATVSGPTVQFQYEDPAPPIGTQFYRLRLLP